MSEEEEIPFAVKHGEILGPIAGFTLMGGFIIIMIIVASDPYSTGGEFILAELLWVFLYFFLGYYLIAKPANEYEEKMKLAVENKKKETRKRKLDTKERELKEAKRLMEKGGIGNLNKAIGIFKKYGK